MSEPESVRRLRDSVRALALELPAPVHADVKARVDEVLSEYGALRIRVSEVADAIGDATLVDGQRVRRLLGAGRWAT